MRAGKRLLAGALALLVFVLAAACADMGSVLDVSHGLVINEVCSANRASLVDPVYGSPDWIELYNDSPADINLFGYMITDSLEDAGKLTLLPDVIVPAHGYVLLYANRSQEQADDAILLNFSLSKGGDKLFLLNNAAEVCDEVAVPALNSDITYARSDADSFGFCATPTPGAANTGALFPSLQAAEEYLAGGTERKVTYLYINEVVSRNGDSYVCPSCGGGHDWVELYNASDEAAYLDGYTLTDAEQQRRLGNLSGLTVEAGGYLVVCCYDADTAFDGEHACVTFGISRDGETLYLYDDLGVAVETLPVPALDTDYAYARREDGSYGVTMLPTPGSANTVPDGDLAAPTAMDDADPIRISEVLARNAYSIADADGDRSDWVELYNASEAAVSLKGYYLSDDSDNLLRFALPDVTLEAGAYVIVFLSGKTDRDMHAPFSLSVGETLTLYDAAENRVDSVFIPELRENVSVGREPDGTLAYYAHPTPGERNANGFPEADQVGFFCMDGVFISEVQAVQKRGSKEQDWIELYNGGAADASLLGWYLSDDPDHPRKFQLGDLVVPAGGYLVIAADASAAPDNGTTASFSLSAQGETLLLYAPNGNLMDVFVTGATAAGQSSGRIETDAAVARVFFTTPTRGKPNDGNAYAGQAALPAFSETGLYHSEAFMLTLACADPDAVIHYTTDGSVPGESSAVYSEPIAVSKSQVVRAVVSRVGALTSDVVTHHYLFVQPHTVPVVCIAMSKGAFAEVWAPKEHSDIVERKSCISYYETGGALGVTFWAGLKAKGQGTLVYRQKSLAIKLRGSYGRRSVSYPFFPDIPFTTFSSLVLRNSGQDALNARIRDAYASRITLGMRVETAATRPVAVYVNGQYYGLYDFGEDLDAGYVETHYGVDRDEVDFIRRNAHVLKGSSEDILRVRAFARKNDFSRDDRYAELVQWVDEEYFIDYVIAQNFFCNSDMFNQKYWRSWDYTVRWRPVLFDLDFAFRQSKRDIMYAYFVKEGIASPDGSRSNMDIYCALRQNDAWCDRFVERSVEVMYAYFTEERLLSIFDGMVAEMRPEMARQIEKWKYPSSMTKWENSLAELRRNVITRRGVFLGQVQDEFHVSNAKMQEYIDKYKTA